MADHQIAKGPLVQVKPKMISIPVIAAGEVTGYIAAQLVFHVDGGALKKMNMKPEDALLDETFKTLYGQSGVDFRNLQKQDLPGISKSIADNVNKRLGMNFVDSVMFHELSYIPRSEVRGKPR